MNKIELPKHGKYILLTYKLKAPEQIFEIIKIFESTGISLLLKTELSLLFLHKTLGFGYCLGQAITKLRLLKFDKTDVIEIAFENKGELELLRFKKKGHKKMDIVNIEDMLKSQLNTSV